MRYFGAWSHESRMSFHWFWGLRILFCIKSLLSMWVEWKRWFNDRRFYRSNILGTLPRELDNVKCNFPRYSSSEHNRDNTSLLFSQIWTLRYIDDGLSLLAHKHTRTRTRTFVNWPRAFFRVFWKIKMKYKRSIIIQRLIITTFDIAVQGDKKPE